MRVALRRGAAVGFVLLAAAGCGALVPLRGTGACAATRCPIEKLAAEITDADYRGRSDYLRFLAGELLVHTLDADRVHDALYWRAFAFWREVLNRLGDGATAAEVDAALSAAAAEFDRLLALDPGNVEARVGLLGCHHVRVFMAANDAAVRRDAYLRALALATELRRDAPRNPRVAWVVAAALFGAPARLGGGQTAAIDYALEVLAAPEEPVRRDALQPRWGRPELLATLGWMLSVRDGPGTRSEAALREALAIRPDWRYARDSLLPQVRAPVDVAEPSGG